MTTAPALANPDYSKPFHLFVAERGGFANAVLMQPIAYIGTQLDTTAQGLPPWYQGLATAAYVYEKASAITMDRAVTLYTSHD